MADMEHGVEQPSSPEAQDYKPFLHVLAVPDEMTVFSQKWQEKGKVLVFLCVTCCCSAAVIT